MVADPICRTVTPKQLDERTSEVEVSDSFYWSVADWPKLQETPQAVLDYQQDVHFSSYLGVNISKWRFGFCKSPKDDQAVVPFAMQIQQNNNHTNVSANIKITMWNSSRTATAIEQQLESVAHLNVPLEFSSIGFGTGSDATIAEMYLHDSNAITFWVSMTIKYEQQRSLKRVKLAEFRKASKARLGKDLDGFRTNPEFQDVTIICSDNKAIKANKSILRARCPVFDAMFGSKMKEQNTGIVNVADVKSNVMEVLMKYWYTGEFPEETLSDSETLEDLAYASEKYGIEEILQLLDCILGDEEVVESSISLWELCEKLGLKNAEQSVAGNIARNIARKAGLAKSSSDILELLGRCQGEPTISGGKTLPEKVNKSAGGE